MYQDAYRLVKLASQHICDRYTERPPFPHGVSPPDVRFGRRMRQAAGGGGGDGARAAEGLREEEDAGKGENEERPVVPIYKERLLSGREK